MSTFDARRLRADSRLHRAPRWTGRGETTRASGTWWSATTWAPPRGRCVRRVDRQGVGRRPRRGSRGHVGQGVRRRPVRRGASVGGLDPLMARDGLGGFDTDFDLEPVLRRGLADSPCGQQIGTSSPGRGFPRDVHFAGAIAVRNRTRCTRGERLTSSSEGHVEHWSDVRLLDVEATARAAACSVASRRSPSRR